MKKSRLKEIIREEIQNVLSEMPVYNVTDKEGFNKAYKEFKDNEVSKSKSLNTILDKLKDTGEVDTKELASQVGKDSATFNNPEIRKFINRKSDQTYTDKKTGEELVDFTPYLDVKSSRKPKPEGEKSTTPKSTKKSTSSKRGPKPGKTSGMDAEDKEAIKAGEKDSIAKAAGKVEGDKEIEAKLKSVVSAKKSKLKKAKEGSLEYEKELAALKQFLDGKNIKKYIKKKYVKNIEDKDKGVDYNPYSISNILKDIE
jgi:hypothetical protein